jgi:hypothetical protein
MNYYTEWPTAHDTHHTPLTVCPWNNCGKPLDRFEIVEQICETHGAEQLDQWDNDTAEFMNAHNERNTTP